MQDKHKIMNWQNLTLLSLFLTLLPWSSFGQQYLFKSYGLEHGLPQSELPSHQAGLVDSEGRIWVLTNGGGMALLEQEKYRVFGIKDGLNSNLLMSMLEDKEGNFWILSQNKNLSKYDGKTFQNFPELNGKLNLGGLLSIDEWGNIWVLAFGGGAGLNNVLYWKPANEDRFKRYRQANLMEFSSPTLTLRHTSQFQTYISLQGKLFVFDGKQFKPVIYPNSDSLFIAKNVFLAHQDKNNNQWVWAADPSTFFGELIFFDSQRKKYDKIEFPAHLIPQGTIPTPLWQVYLASDEKLYVVAHPINVIFVFDKNRRFINSYGVANGLKGFLPNSGLIFEDKYGSVWAGTRGNGLLQLPSNRFANFTQQDGLQGNIIFGISQDQKERMWFGSSTGGLVTYKDRTFETITTAPSVISRISAFWHKNKDTTFAATGAGVMQITVDSTSNFVTQLVNQQFGISAGTFVRQIMEIDSIVWIGTQGKGAIGYDLREDTVVYQFTQKELGSPTATDFQKDTKGNIWIATFGGLVKWDTKGTSPSNFKRYTAKDGLGDNLLLQIYIDKKDIVWVVAYSGGLNRFDGKKFITYQTPEGLSSDIIYSILPVKNTLDQFWIGTQRGLNKGYFRTDGKLIRVEKYAKEDGFLGNESNSKALFEDSEGNIWAGHLKGVTRCNFSKDEKRTPPKTFISEVNLFLSKTNWTDSAYLEYYDSISVWNQLPENLTLPADKNSINFDFYAADFSNSKDIEYQFWLEGLNKDWLVPTKKTEINYSNLSPKRYTFHIRSRAKQDAEWGEESAFEFRVLPHWHQTLGVRIAGVCLVLGLIFGAFKWRTSSLEASRKRLERQVEERTLEVRKRNDEILEKNQELKAQQSKLAEAYDNIQEKNKNITASITYAKRIQDAMLPSRERMHQIVEDCFVFFRPRDIVSGDFYWMSEVENRIFIAAVDCTGHGVPGAFMSVVGSNLLYEIIEGQRIHSPAKILETLDENVRRHLNQDKTNNRDGMDMAICMIDKNEKIITFSGAKNPLLHIYGEELKIIKGDKFPVGGFDKQKQKKFSEHTIIPRENSIFYMYSDGFQDQFGGLEGRKYMSRRFHRFLKSISNLPVWEQQQALDKELERWKEPGNERQIDDVLVIGFRV